MLVVDAGIHAPAGLEPDVAREEVARAAGADVAALAAAGDRGAAVDGDGSRAPSRSSRDLYADGPARRDPRAGRLRRLVDRGAGDACSAGRRAEADRLDRRFGRHAALRRGRRRDDDVLGRRHLRREPRLGADHGQRRRRDRRNGRGDRPAARRRSRSSRRRCSASRHRASRRRASGSRSSATRCSSSMRRAPAASRWRRSRKDGFLAGVLDATTTELADELVGGVLSAGPDRLEAAGAAGVPQVVSLGALDMVNFGPRETVPPQFDERNLYVHNPTVTLMRTTPDECAELGRTIGRKLSARDRADRALHPARRRLDDRRRRASRSTTPAADEALVAGAARDARRLGGGARAQRGHQRPGFRDRDGRPAARADPGARDDARRGARTAARAGRRAARRSSAPAPAPGLSAKLAEAGGADLIIIYNSGRYRMGGRGSLAGLMPYGDANEIVVDMAREVLPVVARDAGARRRLRHRPVPADAGLPRRAEAHRVQRRAELPDGRPDGRHVPGRARGDGDGLRARGRHDPARARARLPDCAVRLRPRTRRRRWPRPAPTCSCRTWA